MVLVILFVLGYCSYTGSAEALVMLAGRCDHSCKGCTVVGLVVALEALAVVVSGC